MSRTFIAIIILSFASIANAEESCQILLEDSSPKKGSCAKTADSLATQETDILESEYAQNTVDSIAALLSGSREIPFDSYTIYRPPLELIALCCDCVPNGDSCTRVDCETPTNHTCPAGKLKVLCSVNDDGVACTSIGD